jgi:hypothetical protein
MSTEKFFENAGRPVEMVEQAQFLNAKPEQEAAESDVVGPLPSPASASPSRPKTKLSAAMIIPIWIILSSGVIVYNNYLYNTLDFKFPVFLVTFHLGFAVRALPANIDIFFFIRSKPYISLGSRHAHTGTDDAPPRWRKGGAPYEGYVYALYSSHRTSLQR